MLKSLRTSLLSVTLLVVLLTVVLVHGPTKSQSVYNVCQRARMQRTQGCGAAEGYAYEYLCSENNNLITNHCWVETK